MAAMHGMGYLVPILPPTPSTAEGLTEEGFKLTREHHWREAIELYRRAITTDASCQRAYWSLGFALNHVGSHEEAITVLEQGLALRTQKREHLGQFHYSLAFAHSSLKRYDEALDHVNEALAVNPGSPKILFLRARIHVFLGNLEEAQNDARSVLRRDPDHSGALALVGELASLEKS